MIKRFYKLLLIMLFLLCNLQGCSRNSFAIKEKDTEIKIGITVYKQEDKFISCMINAIEEYVVKKENETNSKITVNIVDAKGNTTAQNNQVDKFINQDYDVICVNIIDRTAAAMIINKAKKADIPIIFFNREPVEEDINLWEKVYYVGAKAEVSGYIQGKIILDKYRKDKRVVDKNNDGKIQYVMLEGEPEHQDSLIRTESTIKTLTNNGLEIEKLASDSANWQNAQAYEKMTQWINEFGDSIEVVFSNNDDMALGAIHALESADINVEDRPLVVGIDGIPEALNKIKSGYMEGTVFNDNIAQSKLIVDICYEVANKENTEVLKGINGKKYFKTSYEKITKENVDEYIDKYSLND